MASTRRSAFQRADPAPVPEQRSVCAAFSRRGDKDPPRRLGRQVVGYECVTGMASGATTSYIPSVDSRRHGRCAPTGSPGLQLPRTGCDPCARRHAEVCSFPPWSTPAFWPPRPPPSLTRRPVTPGTCPPRRTTSNWSAGPASRVLGKAASRTSPPLATTPTSPSATLRGARRRGHHGHQRSVGSSAGRLHRRGRGMIFLTRGCAGPGRQDRELHGSGPAVQQRALRRGRPRRHLAVGRRQPGEPRRPHRTRR